MKRDLASVALALTLITACQTAAPPRSDAPPYVPAKYQQCWYLQVIPKAFRDAKVSIPENGISCRYGTIESVTPSYANVNTIVFYQSITHGPDCRITFNVDLGNGPSAYVIDVEQPYCNFEALPVKASVVSGSATVTPSQGSYKDAIPGTVYVTLH